MAKWLGTSPKDKFAPGFAFVFGSQDLSIMENAIRNSWLSKDTMLNAALNQKMTENINAQIKIEPIKEFNIDIPKSIPDILVDNVADGGSNHALLLLSELMRVWMVTLLYRS